MFSSELRWRASCFFLLCVLALRTDCAGDGVIPANGDNWMKTVEWFRSCRHSRILLVLTVNQDPAMKEVPAMDDDGSYSKACDIWNLCKWCNNTALEEGTLHWNPYVQSISVTCCFIVCRCEAILKIRFCNLCVWAIVNERSQLPEVNCLQPLKLSELQMLGDVHRFFSEQNLEHIFRQWDLWPTKVSKHFPGDVSLKVLKQL